MADRLLIYVPIAPKTPKIFGRTLTSLFRMEWPYPCDIVFGRNDNPQARGHKYDDLCQKHNEARQMALDGNYDAVFFAENDMVFTPNTLLDLYAVDADVAYGLYCNRHGYHRWLAFSFIQGLHGVSVSQDEELRRKVWGKPFETFGAGLGCTLIRRNVLEAIEFRTHPEHKVADDWLFAEDCRNAGYKQAHHFGVLAGHIRPDGYTLWPDAKAANGYRLEFPPDAKPHLVTKDTPLMVDVGMQTVMVHASNS